MSDDELSRARRIAQSIEERKSSDSEDNQQRKASTEGSTPKSIGSTSRAGLVHRDRIEFDEETEHQMAEWVESYPILWQGSHRDHANSDMRNRTWALAQDVFGYPGEYRNLQY